MDDITKLLDDREQKEVKKRARAKSDTPVEKKKKVSKKETELRAIADSTVLPSNYETVWTESQLIEMCDFLKKQDMFAVDTETTGVNVFIDQIVGFSVFAGGRGWYVPLTHVNDISINQEEYEKVTAKMAEVGSQNVVLGVDYIQCLPKELVVKYVKPILEDRSKKIIGHNFN